MSCFNSIANKEDQFLNFCDKKVFKIHLETFSQNLCYQIKWVILSVPADLSVWNLCSSMEGLLIRNSILYQTDSILKSSTRCLQSIGTKTTTGLYFIQQSPSKIIFRLIFSMFDDESSEAQTPKISNWISSKFPIKMVEKIREHYQKHQRNISSISDVSVSTAEPIKRDENAEIRCVLLCDR